MSDLKAKMNQNRFRLGLRPRPCWGAYSTPDPLAGFKGPTSKGRIWTKGEGRAGKKRDRGRERERRPPALRWYGAPEMVNPALFIHLFIVP